MNTAPTVAAELTWPQVHAFRLRRHHLDPAAKRADLTNVVRDMGGAQAQVMSAAEMQIAVRAGATSADVRHALWRDRTLVKTWLMRGTLHLIPAGDLPLYTAAMQGPWMRVRKSWFDYFQMTEAQLLRLVDDIAQAMDGTPMTREEILARVGGGHSDRVHEMLRSGWGGMLKPVARRGLLCFGPSRGQSVTFVNPHHWLRSWQDFDPEDAIAEIARRYLRAYGPAKRGDFVRWWGGWPGAGRVAWSRLSAELAAVSIEGERADILADDLEVVNTAHASGAVALLPAFDPYLMGHSSRDHMFDRAHSSKVSRTAGWISAVVLVDGRVEGTWTHRIAGRTLQVVLAPFRRQPAPVVAEVRARAKALAAAVGAVRAEVRVSPRARRS